MVSHGEQAEALALVNHMIPLAEKAGLVIGRALLLIWRGCARVDLGDYDGVADMQEAAETLAEHAHPRTAAAYGNLADTSQGLGDLSAADAAFANAAEWATQLRPPVIHDLDRQRTRLPGVSPRRLGHRRPTPRTSCLLRHQPLRLSPHRGLSCGTSTLAGETPPALQRRPQPSFCTAKAPRTMTSSTWALRCKPVAPTSWAIIKPAWTRAIASSPASTRTLPREVPGDVTCAKSLPSSPRQTATMTSAMRRSSSPRSSAGVRRSSSPPKRATPKPQTLHHNRKPSARRRRPPPRRPPGRRARPAS